MHILYSEDALCHGDSVWCWDHMPCLTFCWIRRAQDYFCLFRSSCAQTREVHAWPLSCTLGEGRLFVWCERGTELVLGGECIELGAAEIFSSTRIYGHLDSCSSVRINPRKRAVAMLCDVRRSRLALVSCFVRLSIGLCWSIVWISARSAKYSRWMFSCSACIFNFLFSVNRWRYRLYITVRATANIFSDIKLVYIIL